MVAKVVNVFFVISLLTAMSCASSGGSGTSKSGGKNGDHYEDLSEYRPDFTAAVDTMGSDMPIKNSKPVVDVIPRYDITTEINTLLDSINVIKQDIKTVEGYTVQVYTGINREQANEAKATVYKTLPDSRPAIIYDQPNFKVKVGQFYTKKEAMQTFAALKRELPAAIIIPERISINSNE